MLKQQAVNVRLDPQEMAILTRLANDTGRPRSNLVRTLILWAACDPELKKRLGDLPQPQEVQG
jgi:hypothetical protein